MAELVCVTGATLAAASLAAGYRLAGARTLAVASAAEAEAVIAALVEKGEAAVIGVDGPLYEALPEALRRRFEAAALPVVVPVPTGRRGEAEVARADRVAEVLRRAIGYRIAFDGGER